MIYTKMLPEHVHQVAELEKTCFGDAAWSEKSVASELENPLSLWLVAEDGGKVMGYVGSQTVLDETDLMNVAVDPDFRGQGIATGLIASLIDVLKHRGSNSLTLEVRASNAPAISLYKNFGFLQTGVRKSYYRNPKEDALIMRKEWKHEDPGC